MSRKGKLPIDIPNGVEVKVEDNQICVKGPKGELKQDLIPPIKVDIADGKVTISLHEKYSEMGNFWGLYRALVDNMVIGTTKGWSKGLECVGVGYRAAVKGKQLSLNLGYSHPTDLDIPAGIEVSVEKNTKITIQGPNKQAVGQFAARVRAVRPPEPYKGKGVKYADERIRRKAGKSGKGK